MPKVTLGARRNGAPRAGDDDRRRRTACTARDARRTLGGRVRRRCAMALAALGALVLVPAAASANGGSATARADAALDRALERLVAADGGPPGVIAIVQRGGERRVHTAGVGDVGRGTPPRARDHMRIASTSKAFSGAAALSLVQRGSAPPRRHDRAVAPRPARRLARRDARTAPAAHERPPRLHRQPGVRGRGDLVSAPRATTRGVARLRRRRAASISAGEPVPLLELGQRRGGPDRPGGHRPHLPGRAVEPRARPAPARPYVASPAPCGSRGRSCAATTCPMTARRRT